MKKSRNFFFKSFAILSCLGAFTPTIAADDAVAVTVPEATAEELSPLKRHMGVLKTSMDPAELGVSVKATMDHLMKNPLADLGEGAKEALDAAVHVAVLNELDDGTILPENRIVSSHSVNFIPLDATPTEEAATYYAWLSAIGYVAEMLGTCSPSAAELTEGFVPYLRREAATPSWLVSSTKAINLADLASRVSSLRVAVQLAYRTAQIEKLNDELASRTKIPVLGGKHVFAKGTAVANGHCGWHSVFGNNGETALKQILGLVVDGTIYEPPYYEVVMRRLRDTQGEGIVLDMLGKPDFAAANVEAIATLTRTITALKTRFDEDIALVSEFSPVPADLRGNAPTDALEAAAWSAKADRWLTDNKESFQKWETRRVGIVNTFEQKKWDAIFGVIQKFKFSPGYLANFIGRDFGTIFEGGQLDVTQGETNYLRILQRLNLVNINVWVPGVGDGAEPILVKQSRLSEGYRIANVLLQGKLSGAGVTAGHYDPLISTVTELARVKRHEELVKLQDTLIAAQAASTAAPTIVVQAPTDGSAVVVDGDVPPE